MNRKANPKDLDDARIILEMLLDGYDLTEYELTESVRTILSRLNLLEDTVSTVYADVTEKFAKVF